jgi:tetratricopeptide (TPR) repeat protein
MRKATVLSAAQSCGKKHFFVPDLLSRAFSGRDDVLEVVRRSLHDGQAGEISRAAIWGLPGIGKTQIALCYATRFRSKYPYVFFINATTAETINASYRGIVQMLLADKEDIENLDAARIENLVKAWLADHANWLLIYDNAIETGAVRRYTPLNGSGHIIFTTRNEIAAETLVGRERSHEIFALPLGQAIAFVLRLQNIDPPTQEEEKIAERLAGMVLGVPIAIEQTVLLARLRNISLAAIMPDIQRRRTLLKQSHPASMHENDCSIGTLVSMTLATLATDSPQAVALFRLLVYLDPSSIPLEFLTHAADEMQYHFARQQTYNRGLNFTASEINEQRTRPPVDRPFYESNPFEKDFWKSRIPFRPQPNTTALPRIDSNADKAVEQFFKDNRLLRDVLEKDVRIENAILDLKKAGLIRRLNDKTIWIHDLFAQLTIALVEEESQSAHQVTAHMALLLIYFVFPLPDYNKEMAFCFRYLPHAITVLQHCRPFYNDLTIGPELAHLTASTFSLKISEFSPEKDQYAVDNAILYYKLAFVGYHHAWHRLRSHPLVTEKEIILCAKTEYAEEDRKGKRHIYALHYGRNQRFSSFATARAFQTCLKLGARVYQVIGQYDEAVKWSEIAVKGFQNLYGEHHDETHESRSSLLRLYKCAGLWVHGYTLGRAMALAYVKRWGEGFLSTTGGLIAADIGDCAWGLRDTEDAIWWYDITLRGLIHLHGDNDESQLVILLKLARVESWQHAHGKSFRFAEKGLRIYEDANRDQPHWNRPCTDRAIDLEVTIARQQFERGNFTEAKEGCQRALRLCKWDPQMDHGDYADYRPVWDSGLEAVWVWGCIEFDVENAPEEWDITPLTITKDLSRQALEMYGPLRRPCCGKDYGDEGWNPGGGVQTEIQKLLEELG